MEIKDKRTKESRWWCFSSDLRKVEIYDNKFCRGKCIKKYDMLDMFNDYDVVKGRKK